MSGPRVSIMMGSPRDWPVMEACHKVLVALDVPHEVFVTSAHKTPMRTHHYVEDITTRGVQVAICGAGAAAHLAGVVAASFAGPVIAVPIAATELAGVDALLASVQMPPGVPVATVAVGKMGAKNAGLLAAQILSTGDPELAEVVRRYRAQVASTLVREADALLETLDPAARGPMGAAP